MKDIEIELQVRVENVTPLTNLLESDAKYIGEYTQLDEYFSPAHRDFAGKKPIEEWLRIRSSKESSVTYKKFHYDANGRSNYCDEFETGISDPAQFKKILDAIDYTVVVSVDKTRKIYWYYDYEVAIDKVKHQGDFVEIEYKGPDRGLSPDSIIRSMTQFLKDLNCGKLERNFRGYAYTALYPDEHVFEEI